MTVRVLAVCSSFRVFGAETVTLKLLEGLKLNGHELLAVTSIWTDGEFSRRLRKLEIEEEVLPFGAVVASFSPRYIKWTVDCLVRVPVLWWKWRRIIREFKPDVVLWTSSKQMLLVLPWLHRTRSVLIEHTNVAPTPNMLWLYSRLARAAQAFVAVSNFMGGHLCALGLPDEKIRVIKNGVLFERQMRGLVEQAKIRPSPNRMRRVGIIGQISQNKGHELLLDSVRLLTSSNFGVKVEVFGEGSSEYVSKLKSRVSEVGLSANWNWNGYEPDKNEIFPNIDICVIPSCFEDPFPTVALEASAYGLPVIASRVGGLPEIVQDGITGWLVEPNSAEKLAERIRHLIENPHQAAEMGAAGRQRVFENFTVEKMVSEFEKLFKDLLKG